MSGLFWQLNFDIYNLSSYLYGQNFGPEETLWFIVKLKHMMSWCMLSIQVDKYDMIYVQIV